MDKYVKLEDIQKIFADENRPLNWTDTEAEAQEAWDFDFYKSQIESLPTHTNVKENTGTWETKKVKHMCPRDAWYPGVFAIEDSWDEEEGSYLVEEEGFCSECGKQDRDYSSHNYCPYCGARMESDE